MVMNKFYMSLDEVGKNEFYIACLYLVKDIIRDVEKREGFNMDRNNYHLLTDDEIFILKPSLDRKSTRLNSSH